jgi:Glycosyl transferase family 2
MAQPWPDVDRDVRLAESLSDDRADLRYASNGSLSEAGDVIRVDDRFADELKDRPNRIAILLPCFNEAPTIAKVIADFQAAIPEAAIYVYDNASTDGTEMVAHLAGAIVRNVPLRGKGNVIRRMFAEIEADIYILADGDDTYDAKASPELVEHLVEKRLDMVVGTRVDSIVAKDAYRPGHRIGNQMLTRAVQWIFGEGSCDLLSGYRVFSHRFVKTFPALSCGFEAETEMTVHALELSLPFEEVPTAYRPRPDHADSKLRTFRDGYRILRFIVSLWKDYRPLRFFGLFAALLAIAAGIVALAGGGASWSPATVTAVGLASISAILFMAGLLLDSIGRRQREMKRMICFGLPANQPSSVIEPS